MMQPTLFKPPPAQPKPKPATKTYTGHDIGALVTRYRNTLNIEDRPKATTYIAEHIGTTYKTVNERITTGRHLTDSEADKWATALGWHPTTIWPNWGNQ